jgi:chaperonin cofactor prefoldin
MTTFTTEDREQAYEHTTPTVIVDSGSSAIKTLGAYIEVEQRIEMYRKQMDIMQAEIQRLKKKLMEAGIDD